MVVITQLIEKSVRCFATVGQGEGEQIVSIGKGCGTPGFALHELAHVIGIVPQGLRLQLGIQIGSGKTFFRKNYAFQDSHFDP